MAAPSEAPVTRQVSGHAAPAPVPSGPASWQPLAAAVAAAVAELPVLDASGRPVLFGELFRERRAIVVFVRVSTGDGTIQRRDLTCRQGWRLLPRPPLGGVISGLWKGPGPENGARPA